MNKKQLADKLRLKLVVKNKTPLNHFSDISDDEIIHGFTMCFDQSGNEYNYLFDHPELLNQIINLSDTLDEFLNYAYDSIQDVFEQKVETTKRKRK